MFLLVMGGLLMPGGFLLSNVIQGVVANEIDTALLGIEEEGVPMVEEMVKQMGVGEVMYRIYTMAGPIVEEMVNATFMAYILKMMKEGLEMTYDYYYESLSMNIELDVTGENATNAELFNTADYVFEINADGWIGLIHVDILDIDGIACYLGATKSYPASAMTRILYGNNTGDDSSPYYIPGLLQDTDSGSGIVDFLALYDAAVIDTELQDDMYNMYVCSSWTQIVDVVSYLRGYLQTEMIPILLAPVSRSVEVLGIGLMTVELDLLATLKPDLAGMTSTDEIADAIFKELWANGTAMGEVVYPGGLDFGDMVEGLPDNTVGFEVGMPPNPSGITRAVVTLLWNKTNPLSIFNMDAMETWYDAWTDASKKQLLLDTFPGLTPEQLDMLLTWMWDGSDSFSQFVVPILLESSEGYGIPLQIFAKNLLLEQWANGTIMGEVMFPYGFALPLGEDLIVYGLEVGYRSETETVLSTGMSLESANALWDKTNAYSLVTDEGLTMWWKAAEDPASTEALTLQSENGLSNTAMTMLYAWLVVFKTNTMPFLAQYQLDLPFDTTTLCQMLTMGGFGIGAMLMVTGSVVSVKRSRAAKGRDPSALTRSMKAVKMSQYKAVDSAVPTTNAQHLQINVTAPERQAEIPKSSISSPVPQAAPVVIYTPSVSFVPTPLPQQPQVQPVAPAPVQPAVASYTPPAVASRSLPTVAPLPAPIKEQPVVPPTVAPATTEISMPEITTPEEKEFFGKIMSGIKMIRTKITRKESVDPLFISNLLYLLRTRRKRYEIQGNTATVQKMDSMYRGIEELRNEARSLLKKS